MQFVYEYAYSEKLSVRFYSDSGTFWVAATDLWACVHNSRELKSNTANFVARITEGKRMGMTRRGDAKMTNVILLSLSQGLPALLKRLKTAPKNLSRLRYMRLLMTLSSAAVEMGDAHSGLSQQLSDALNFV